MVTKTSSNASPGVLPGLVITRAMVSLIGDANPDSLGALRKRFPQYEDIFERVYVLGAPSNAPPDTPCREDRVQALEALVRTTIAISMPLIERAISSLMTRGRIARNARLIGTAIATFSSAGVITSIATSHSIIALGVSVLTIFGSISALLGEHFEKPFIGGQKSLGELLGDAVLVESQIREIQIILIGEEQKDQATILGLARRTNEIAATIKRICVFGGVEMSYCASGPTLPGHDVS